MWCPKVWWLQCGERWRPSSQSNSYSGRRYVKGCCWVSGESQGCTQIDREFLLEVASVAHRCAAGGEAQNMGGWVLCRSRCWGCVVRRRWLQACRSWFEWQANPARTAEQGDRDECSCEPLMILSQSQSLICCLPRSSSFYPSHAPSCDSTSCVMKCISVASGWQERNQASHRVDMICHAMRHNPLRSALEFSPQQMIDFEVGDQADFLRFAYDIPRSIPTKSGLKQYVDRLQGLADNMLWCQLVCCTWDICSWFAARACFQLNICLVCLQLDMCINIMHLL